ncbi:leucyl aminopeptidase [Shewanella intestini]|uniref:Probable cytosol aminopeptidase n=1 Tax=Shewanella intestini TaxID=2017544 RepID=A0ABS5I665_9GAMM|nr:MULTISPECIES: leucyl aminopeptidase [Shewanella]MBR9729209.1 leucyl aminopeptidase [Shewanella intestini]MRG37220.1 leucyl aminopeptidase [Shewanella sp. XMDDZSB0408]
MTFSFNVTNQSPATVKADAIVVFVAKDGALSSSAQAIEDANQGLISKRLSCKDLAEKSGNAITLFDPAAIKAERVVVVYTESFTLDAQDFDELCDSLSTILTSLKQANITVCLNDLTVNGQNEAYLVQQLADVLVKNTYKFTGFKSDDDTNEPLASVVSFYSENQQAVAQAAKTGVSVANGKNVARHLGNLPPNICHPTYLAETALTLAEQNNKLSVRIVDEAEMAELGMHSLLSVGNGSAQPSKLIVMEYKGAAQADAKPYALVGKGVTFDSGGISLKPGAAMDEMKFDMCGAASVFGTVASVVELDLPINLVAVVGAAENMPSDCATRPGDVIKTMSGKTIEVLNTDAEGRLVLCDALTFVQQYQPKTIIDIATLTGAIIVALGDQAAGLFSNDQAFADTLIKSGEQTGDLLWQFPIWERYGKKLKSNFADLANIGTPGAGSITAACFLSEFVKDQTWAHIDIAGVAWNKGNSKGATGKPVGLLVNYLMNVK